MSAGSRFAAALVLAVTAGAAAATTACGADAVASTDDDIVASSRCNKDEQSKIDRMLQAAETDLARLGSAYAGELRAHIASGALRVLPFCAMNKTEFRELRKYADFSSLGEGGRRPTVPELYDALHDADPAMVALVNDQFFGFQWGRRVFFSTTQRRGEFLETLAHEARHSLRDAHERDYDDPSILCEEELAAYEAEILVRRDGVTADERSAIHAKMRGLYDLSMLRAGTCAKR
jgi:hypothetical protein